MTSKRPSIDGEKAAKQRAKPLLERGKGGEQTILLASERQMEV